MYEVVVPETDVNGPTPASTSANICVSRPLTTIGDKLVETLYLNRVISENKRIRTPPLSPPFKVGVFVV